MPIVINLFLPVISGDKLECWTHGDPLSGLFPTVTIKDQVRLEMLSRVKDSSVVTPKCK